MINNNNNNVHGGNKNEVTVTQGLNLIHQQKHRKALVIYDYNKKSTTEVTLAKSQVVNILDAKAGAEWWRVQDELGRIGYYPSHYLRIV